MYLYLKYNNHVTRVSNIYLERGLNPIVGTYIQEGVDPSLWFKALVLDSVFVDCDIDQRQIYWCGETPESQEDSMTVHAVENESLDPTNVQNYFRQKGKKNFAG